jgi:hypothetical protein
VCEVPSLWSSAQGSQLQIQIQFLELSDFWEVVGLERGALSLVRTIEELFGRNSSGSGQENLDYGRREPSRWIPNTFYPQTLALIWPTRGGRSVGIVHSRTKATDLLVIKLIWMGELRDHVLFQKLLASTWKDFAVNQ